MKCNLQYTYLDSVDCVLLLIIQKSNYAAISTRVTILIAVPRSVWEVGPFLPTRVKAWTLTIKYSLFI